jgi:hypothetical protein
MTVQRDLIELGQAYSELVGKTVAVRVALIDGSWTISLHPTGEVYDDRSVVVSDRTLGKTIEITQGAIRTLAFRKRIEEGDE